MTILIFFAVLFVLVLVHEWGHFIVAKKSGMRVDEFGIGFPPKLWGFKKGETEYTFNLFPIGGFVRIFGENAEEAEILTQEGKKNTEGSFTSKNKWAQVAVLIAGVTMNILFAWVLFVSAFMIGLPTVVEEGQASEKAQLTILDVMKDTPAYGVLPVGVKIVRMSAGEDSLERLTPSSFRSFIQAHADQELSITYKDGSVEKEVEVVAQDALIANAPEQRAVGVSLAMVERISEPFLTALSKASVTTIQTLKAIVVGVSSLIVQSIQGDADYSQVAGPVGIVSLVGDAASFGITSLMMFTAVISLNLAVINLLPFPALDGGRLLFVAIEAVTRKPIKPSWVARLNMVGFLLLMVLMVAVTYNDILRLL